MPVVWPSRLLLLTLLLTLVVNGISLSLLLIALPLQQARTGSGARTLDEPFAGFVLLFGQFNTDGEANLAVWFSSLLLVMVALTGAGIWLTLRRRGAPWRSHWLALSLVFFSVSLDESSVIHELAIPLMGQFVEASGVLTFTWVVLVAPVVVVLALTFLPFLWKLAHRTGLLLAAAGVVFVSGALGLELLGGWFFDADGPETTQYVRTTTVEELLENLGAVLALYAVSRHATLTFGPHPVSAPARQAAPAPGPDGQASGDRATSDQLTESPTTAG